MSHPAKKVSIAKLERKCEKFESKLKELKDEKAVFVKEIRDAVESGKKLDKNDQGFTQKQQKINEQIQLAESTIQERDYDEKIREMQENLEALVEGEKSID